MYLQLTRVRKATSALAAIQTKQTHFIVYFTCFVDKHTHQKMHMTTKTRTRVNDAGKSRAVNSSSGPRVISGEAGVKPPVKI